jgi:phosphate transport system permease protein
VPSPDRFKTARSTILIDAFMNRFIKVGGVSVVVAVMAIFVFIGFQILPLFRTARVSPLKTVQLPEGRYVGLGLDEYSVLPVLVDADGRIGFFDLQGDRGLMHVNPGFDSERRLTVAAYHPGRQDVVVGTADGHFSLVSLGFETGEVDGRRVVTGEAKAAPFTAVGKMGHPIRLIRYGDAGDTKLLAAVQDVEGRSELHVALLSQERTLLGAGEIKVEKSRDLTGLLSGRPVHLQVNRAADAVVVATESGDVQYFVLVGEEFVLRQTFRPFGDLANPRVARMDFLLGDVTLVFSGAGGESRLFSLYVPVGGSDRLFGEIHRMPTLGAAAVFYAASMRNKAYLTGDARRVQLCYATTEKVRWEFVSSQDVVLGAMGSKYDRLALLDATGRLTLFSLDDPHPEASFRAMFGKVWYEGADCPKYEWQSTGGSDDFEPKFSMVPLVVGTLKGTLFGMLFGVPVALLAALYISQFALPRVRAVVKPLMEIMASLPSVVLGFLAALWLAPLAETRVPSLLLIAVSIPLAAMGMGMVWERMPAEVRVKVRPGFEFVAFFPVMLLVTWVAWRLGPAFEQWAFSVGDGAGGVTGDFRRWWPQVMGADFQQRNSLVVGFVMGFAVIPIVFTITEDSLSAVPSSLRTGSLALGASRWQTALRVILPTASAGIFSALMIALGRAVGETMIVVMATGNTPIMDLNLFSGMRTLSANIAVELPEAPHHGTLYRALFLGAMVLFSLTFAVNTVAEVFRQRLREKFKLS